MSTEHVILVTGASSGFGALISRELAVAGHVVYAGMRDLSAHDGRPVADAAQWAADHDATLRAIQLDVTSQDQADAAAEHIVAEAGRIDVVVHNAGHMVLGATEAFTAEQLAHLYDVNVLGTQRVNRAVLPQFRARRSGLLVWIGSSSFRGGTPPFLAPYFAAKAGMDALAVSYAAELIKFGIETTIVVPGPFTSGTAHFANAGRPEDTAVDSAYDEEYGEIRAQIPARLAALEPAGTTIQPVADAVVSVVGASAGSRPFRVHVDPTNDGCEVVSAVADRMRVEFLRRLGLTELLGAQPSL